MDQAENKEYKIGEKKGKHDVYIVRKRESTMFTLWEKVKKGEAYGNGRREGQKKGDSQLVLILICYWIIKLQILLNRDISMFSTDVFVISRWWIKYHNGCAVYYKQ